jgi:hypothetical protein
MNRAGIKYAFCSTPIALSTCVTLCMMEVTRVGSISWVKPSSRVMF